MKRSCSLSLPLFDESHSTWEASNAPALSPHPCPHAPPCPLSSRPTLTHPLPPPQLRAIMKARAQGNKHMIVLHALWHNLFPGKLHIWGESSSLPAASKRAGRPAERTPRQPPLTLPHDPLLEALGELAGSLLFASATSDIPA